MDTQSLTHPERRKAERRQGHAPSQQHGSKQHEHSMQMGSYGRFWAMVAASTAIGWAAMYLNTYQIDHVFFSWTRVFMAMIMGGVMTSVMIAFMWKMYPNKRANQAVLGVAAGLFIAGVGLVRSQATVGDVAYMQAMIPHHSIAVLTSSRARIEDPRVRRLADGIIEAQVREIEEMKLLIADIERSGFRGTTRLPARSTKLTTEMEQRAREAVQ